MTTKIFAVEYWITERYNGKGAHTYKSIFNVAAKHGQDAINKTLEKAAKSHSYVNELKKKVTITKSEFEVISVNLKAETD